MCNRQKQNIEENTSQNMYLLFKINNLSYTEYHFKILQGKKKAQVPKEKVLEMKKLSPF